jgi:hypothetical protein
MLLPLAGRAAAHGERPGSDAKELEVYCWGKHASAWWERDVGGRKNSLH